MSQPQDPIPAQGSATDAPPASNMSASDALPPPQPLPTTARPSPVALVGGGAGAAGGALTFVGFFLPWVTLLAVVGGCGRGPLQIAMVTLTAWNLALGNAGLLLAVATWLMLVMALFIINFGLRAVFDRRRPLRRARLMIGAAVVALVDAGAQSYLWATNVLRPNSAPGVNTVFSSAFQGFGSGLWVIVSGLLAALTGGVLLHAAARSPGRKQPLPETALAVASILALVGSGAVATGIVPLPSLATLTVACQKAGGAAEAPSSQSLYATVEDTVYALRPGDGKVRWQCQNSLVNLQTAGPPALADGAMYVASLDGSVFAVRTDDGALLWHRTIATGSQYSLGLGNFGAPALVAAGGAIYGNDGTGGVFALRAADGAALWHNTSLRLYPTQFARPLVVADGVIYGAPDYPYGGVQGLFALDAHTGVLLWRSSVPTLARTAIAVAGGRTYDEEIESGASIVTTYLVARAASDGTVVWRFPLLETSSAGTLSPALPFTVADGVIYLQTNAAAATPELPRPVVRALRATDGRVLWSFFTDLTPAEGQMDGGSGVTVVAGTVYVAVSNLTNSLYVVDLYALSARDGSFLWHTQPFPDGLSVDQGALQSPIGIVVANGTAYPVAAGRNLAALDVRNGSLLWLYRPMPAQGTQNQFPLSTTPPVVVSGDLVYLAADRLYALDTRDGSVRWQLAAPHAPSQGTAITFSAPVLGP